MAAAPQLRDIQVILVNLDGGTAMGLRDIAVVLMYPAVRGPFAMAKHRIGSVGLPVPQRIEDDVRHRIFAAPVLLSQIGDPGRRAAVDPGGVPLRMQRAGQADRNRRTPPARLGL